MITLPLFQYLTSPRDLTGSSDVVAFANPIRIGNMTVRNRNDARRYLRDRIGKRVYAGRKLDSGMDAVTLRKISGSAESHLKGDERTTSIIQVDSWAKGPGANLRCMANAELVRLAVVYYRGNWGKETNVYVGTVTVVRSNQVIDSPRDGSSYWDFRCSADYQVSYFHNRVEVA